MSIIPLFILLFLLTTAILQLKVGSLIPKELLNSPIKPFLNQVERLISNPGLLTGTSAIVMIWFSRGMFTSIEKSFSAILDKKNPAGFLYRNIVAILTIFLLWFLMFFIYTLKHFIVLLFPNLISVSVISSVAIAALLFFILIGIYYFMLPVNIPLLFIVKASSIIFLILIVFERAFVWFIVNMSKVSLVYGTFAAVVVFLLWIYYSAVVILLGAGIAKGKILIKEAEIANGKANS